jgi:hypothetical protein
LTSSVSNVVAPHPTSLSVHIKLILHLDASFFSIWCSNADDANFEGILFKIIYCILLTKVVISNQIGPSSQVIQRSFEPGTLPFCQEFYDSSTNDM